MNNKFVIVSFGAVLSGLAALVPSASAGPDFRLHLDLPAPPVLVIGHSERAREEGRPGESRGEWTERHEHPYRREGDRSEGRSHEVYRASPPRGYWKEVAVRSWVPAHWEYGYDNRGRQVRTFYRGHEQVHAEQIWVEACR